MPVSSNWFRIENLQFSDSGSIPDTGTNNGKWVQIPSASLNKV